MPESHPPGQEQPLLISVPSDFIKIILDTIHKVVKGKLETFLPSHAKQFLEVCCEPQLFHWQGSKMLHSVTLCAVIAIMRNILSECSAVSFFLHSWLMVAVVICCAIFSSGPFFMVVQSRVPGQISVGKRPQQNVATSNQPPKMSYMVVVFFLFILSSSFFFFSSVSGFHFLSGRVQVIRTQSASHIHLMMHTLLVHVLLVPSIISPIWTTTPDSLWGNISPGGWG